MKTVEENFEADKIQAAIDYLEFKGELDKIKAQAIKELQKEKKELKAHCEFLRECCHRLGNGLRVEKDEVDSIPQHSLNKIKAQAIEEATYNVKPVKNNLGRYYLRATDFLDYAKRLRGE